MGEGLHVEADGEHLGAQHDGDDTALADGADPRDDVLAHRGLGRGGLAVVEHELACAAVGQRGLDRGDEARGAGEIGRTALPDLEPVVDGGEPVLVRGSHATRGLPSA
ncbi:MAG: hypothetical protein IPN32_32810 [Deltaproteobacteria bacterium]|nr:hypothetical protein [Deltaproteobacteria bacterium]